MNLRILTLLPILLLSTLFVSAHDFEAVNADGVTIYYKKISDTEVAVTFRGSSYFYSDEYTGSVNIPSTVTSFVNTYSVTSIGDWAFSDCCGLTSVTIPNSVTSIGNDAFYGCFRLTSVTIGNSVTSIGDYAFYGTGIFNNKANWTDGVLYIDDCLITAESSLRGNYAIKTNTRLIAAYAFADCSGLTSVTIPNSVTSIGNYAFYGCSGLTSVTIPESVTEICKGAFYGCSGLTSVTIPGSVTSIGNGAFYGCSGLTSVTIPNSVTSIGYAAFRDCSGLKEIYSKIKEPKSVKTGSRVFDNVPNTALLYVPIGSKGDYMATSPWNAFLNIIEMDYGSEMMGDCNGDGEIDASDIAHIVDYLLGISHDNFDSNAADFNGDGKVDATDISLIISLIISE